MKTREELEARVEDRRLRIGLLVYRPAEAKEPVPVFLGLNFMGNHTVNADPPPRLR